MKMTNHFDVRPFPASFDRFERLTFCALWTVLISMLAVLLLSNTGCESAAMRAAIQDAQNQKAAIAAKAVVDTANVEAKAKVNAAKAKAAPVSHPIDSTNQTISRIRAVLIPVTIFASILFAVSIGLLFTPLSVISKIAVPVTGAVALLSFVNVIALPFMPWVIVGGAVILIGLSVYEVIRYKSIGAAFKAVESDFGITSTSSVTSTVESAVTKVTASVESILPKAGTSSAPIVVTTPTVTSK